MMETTTTSTLMTTSQNNNIIDQLINKIIQMIELRIKKVYKNLTSAIERYIEFIKKIFGVNLI